MMSPIKGLAAPHHVGKRRIDHEQPNTWEGRHGTKLERRQAARDDSSRDHSKCHLEGDVDDLRVDGTVRRGALSRLQHLVEHGQAQQLVRQVSNKRAGTVAAVGQRPPATIHSTPTATGAKAHEHGVDDIFAPGQAT